MKTDKHLYAIFAANPQWIFELAELESPGECELRAVSLKALEQQSDGVVFPKDPAEELTVVEFQFQEDPAIYNRIVMEMVLVQRDNAMREVRGVIFFRHASLDPRTEPWRRIVDSRALSDVLEDLERRDPDHPLVAVFRPVLLSSEANLERHAAEYYNQIRSSALSDATKTTLLEVFVSWVEQRLKHLGKKEIEKMFLGELPDLRDTQSGKDLIQIGRVEGRMEGNLEGKREALIWALEAKFGTVAQEIRERIEREQSVDKLKDLLLQVLTIDAIEQLKW